MSLVQGQSIGALPYEYSPSVTAFMDEFRSNLNNMQPGLSGRWYTRPKQPTRMVALPLNEHNLFMMNSFSTVKLDRRAGYPEGF